MVSDAEVPPGFVFRKLGKRKSCFEGLRGVVSDHIPTVARSVCMPRGTRRTRVRNVLPAAPYTKTAARISPERTSARNHLPVLHLSDTS